MRAMNRELRECAQREDIEAANANSAAAASIPVHDTAGAAPVTATPSAADTPAAADGDATEGMEAAEIRNGGSVVSGAVSAPA